jgi:hypothetical protein
MGFKGDFRQREDLMRIGDPISCPSAGPRNSRPRLLPKRMTHMFCRGSDSFFDAQKARLLRKPASPLKSDTLVTEYQRGLVEPAFSQSERL